VMPYSQGLRFLAQFIFIPQVWHSPPYEPLLAYGCGFFIATHGKIGYPVLL